ncbi:MAG TPA: hypothetical protein VF765_37520 [Polyangiaceae bacterium]
MPIALLLACLTVSAPTPAAPEPTVEPTLAQRGLQLGARLGYALPTGALSNNASLSTPISQLETASVPIGIDAGYRLSPTAYLGGTVAWGPGIAPNAQGTCAAGASCFRQDAQLRAEARFYFTPERRVTWWASAGAGWEVAAFSQSVNGNGVTATLTGPVLADLELGFDTRRSASAVGLYFGLSLAEFLTHGESPAATPVATWIDSPSFHAWFTLGLKGSYGPW